MSNRLNGGVVWTLELVIFKAIPHVKNSRAQEGRGFKGSAHAALPVCSGSASQNLMAKINTGPSCFQASAAAAPSFKDAHTHQQCTCLWRRPVISSNLFEAVRTRGEIICLRGTRVLHHPRHVHAENTHARRNPRYPHFKRELLKIKVDGWETFFPRHHFFSSPSLVLPLTHTHSLPLRLSAPLSQPRDFCALGTDTRDGQLSRRERSTRVQLINLRRAANAPFGETVSERLPLWPTKRDKGCT